MKYTILILAFLLTSCEERIELTLNEPHLVVEGYLSNHGELEVRLSQTISKTDSLGVPLVTDAELMLTDANGAAFKLLNMGQGNYYVDGIPDLPSQIYTLTVQHEGQQYVASSMMPPISLQADSLQHVYINDSLGQPINSVLNIFYSNPSLVDVYGLLTIDIDTIECCEGQLFEELSPTVVAQKRSFPLGQAIPPGNRIKLRVFQSDARIYKIFKEQQFIRQGDDQGVGGLTIAPPINLSSNFDNGALGFFAAVRVDTASVVVR